MNTHEDLLKCMEGFRATLSLRFKWFIHETPFVFIDIINSTGLVPKSDAAPPAEVKAHLRSERVPILCLHPLGAKLIPRGAANSLVVAIGDPEPQRVRLAISSEDLPKRIGLDWSFEWSRQEARIRGNTNLPIEAVGCELADEFGSIVSYDPISANLLKVCTHGVDSDLPDIWPNLNRVENTAILLF